MAKRKRRTKLSKKARLEEDLTGALAYIDNEYREVVEHRNSMELCDSPLCFDCRIHEAVINARVSAIEKLQSAFTDELNKLHA